MHPSTSNKTLEAQLLSEYDDIPAEIPQSALPPTDLPCDDGEPLETPWHRAAMNLLIDAITSHFRDREDFFVGGNMFLYFRQQQWQAEGDRPQFRGPDFFYVQGVERRRPRLYYAVWEEGGCYPNVIVELMSPTTQRIDRVDKVELYQTTFRTPEYFLCEREVTSLEGFRLSSRQKYEPIAANERGWLWSEQLQLWLGSWVGTYLGETTTWLRFYDASGQLVLREDERMQQRAEQEKQRAEQEKQRAEQEKQRAEQEKQRADAAEAEAERLRHELEELRRNLPPKQQ